MSGQPKDKDCIFCKIVAGEIPCAKVLENDLFIAFLDIAPVRPGHALVLPKAHYPTLWDLPDDIGGGLLATAKAVGKAVMEATGAEGLNVFMNNHRAAGQEVDHAHVHLIPRVSDDGLRLWGGHPYKEQSAMGQMADAMRKIIG